MRTAIRALLKNKLRSFLTILGIIIGVGAVIAMVAIGEGAKARVQKTFEAMGTNLLILQSGSSRSAGVRGGQGSAPSLTWEDLRAIEKEVSSIRYAVPQLTARMQIVSDDANWSTQIRGTTPEYFDVRNWPIDMGGRFTQTDVEGGTKVAILGRTVSDNLFGEGVDPVGQVVRINNVPYQVVGLAAKKGQSAFGQDYDDAAFVPVSTYRSKISGEMGAFVNGQVLIGARSAADTSRAQQQISALLRDRHRIRQGQEDDFTIRNLTEIASAEQESTATFTLLLAGIAAVSLLVGGIGIMNIMIVSVTERTREIGIRMAVGAKPRQILAQFLIESVTLAAVGGVIGLGAGVSVARWLATRFGWPTVIRVDTIIIAIAFSAVVGIVFGLYPASRASRLDPIQALRYE
jgi:putative ABC transport system permease protein